MSKAPSQHEIYNDLDDRVFNFFRVLRERPQELINALRFTPYSRTEYRLAYEKADDPVEDARRLYVLSWQGRGGGYTSGSVGRNGWRYQNKAWKGADVVREWARHDDLEAFADRLLGVQLECDSAFEVIPRYDSEDTLFYVDPPYLKETRSPTHRREYFCELETEDHIKLAELLNGIKGMAIVSGYPSQLYSELFPGWTLVSKASRTQARTDAEECLWISPSCDRVRSRQMTLF